MKRHAVTAVCAMLTMLIFSTGICLAQQLKIGFVDFVEFATKSKRAQAQQKKFQQLVAQKQGALHKKKKEMEDLQEQIQKQSPMLTEEKRNQMIKDLGIKEMELKLAQREAENLLRNEQRDAQEVFQRDVVKIVSEIRKQKGLTMILNASALLSVDDALNVTDAVVKAYDAQKPAARPAARPAVRTAPPRAADQRKNGPAR
jgi:outer membrane protein